MLLQLFETSLLLEINLEKSKPRLRQMLAAGFEDITFWKSFATLHGDALGSSEAKFLYSYLDEPGKNAKADNEIDYIIEQAYQRLLEIDPTKNAPSNKHRYVNWLITQYIKGNIKFWEDMSTMGELLGRYDALKVRQVFTRMAKDGDHSPEVLLKYNDVNNIRGKAGMSHVVRYGEDWLKKNEEKDMTTEWLRYVHWEHNGGIEVIYPPRYEPRGEHGGRGDVPFTTRLKMFSETGAVLKLRTVEASVALFQKSTAWCTARPGNEHFDEYTNGETEEVSENDWRVFADETGLDYDDEDARANYIHDASSSGVNGSPLFVIVDNVNDKYYQLHKASGQYLDENDSEDYNAYTIPLPLMRVAAMALRSDVAGLYTQMHVTPSSLLNIVSQYDETKGDRNMSAELWHQCLKRMVDLSAKELDFVIHAYVNEHGSLPPNEEVVLVVNRMFGIMPQDVEAGVYADGFDCALSIILHYARKTNNLDIMQALFKRVSVFSWLVIGFYSNTPLWKQARAHLLSKLMENPKSIEWLTPSPTNSRTVKYLGSLKPPPLFSTSAYRLLDLSQDEIDALVSVAAKRYPHDVSRVINFFDNLGTPASDAVRNLRLPPSTLNGIHGVT